MRYVLILLGLLVANAASAIDCQKLPSCEELGYSKEEVKGCAADGYVYCPFDDAYKTCVNYDCATLGFTESDKTSWCADLIKCKGNSQMTLCQKPCFATDAQSLAELASSGKCKVVTMKNDITIPANQDITLAKNTTLDGSGHKISATLTSFTLLDGAKLKNLHIHRKIDSTENLILISVQGNVSFEDLSVLDENNNSSQTGGRELCDIYGSLTLSGTLKFEVKNDVIHRVFESLNAVSNIAKIILENANVEIISPPDSSDAFSYVGEVVSKNSEIHVKTESYVIAAQTNEQIELVDSKMIVENSLAVYWIGNNEYTFKLGEGGYFDTKQNDLVRGGGKLKFIFNGTADKPATLVIGKEHKGDDVTLEVQNTAAELKYMGITYRPKQIGTTLLKDVESSENWEVVSPKS